jgi:hypothetical protein
MRERIRFENEILDLGLLTKILPAWGAGPLRINLNTPPELSSLLKYLGVDYITFWPWETKYFIRLKELLVFNGIINQQVTIDRTNFSQYIKSFQLREKMADADGLPGEETLWRLQKNWANQRNLEINRVAADKVGSYEGYSYFELREDIAKLYDAMRSEITKFGGVITSDGGSRALDVIIKDSGSTASFHYGYMAIDLAMSTGMQNPATDPFIITKEGKGWHVWQRNEKGIEQTLDAVRAYSKKVGDKYIGKTDVKKVTTKVIDFTYIARKYGFFPIGPKSCFPSNEACAEWWHFQCEAVLVPFISQFGIELLSLRKYTEADLNQHSHIKSNLKKIFKRKGGWG